MSDSLNDVINQVYEAALKADPQCWQAPWLEGRLFLSGYNESAATKELTRALQINPRAAEALVTLGQADLQGYKLAAGRSKAERALEINPRYGPAFVLLWRREPGPRAVGFAVGRRLGGSVVRNRARRRLREAYRRQRALVAPDGIRLCFIARQAALTSPFTELSRLMADALVQTARNPRSR